MSKSKKLVFTSLCIAAGVALPLAFHGVPGAGMIFLPMHIPILLCGLLCGWKSGLLCGIVTPLLSALLTSMPPAAKLPGMLFELAVYGATAGFLMMTAHPKNKTAHLYLALIGAMVAGRIMSGAANALFFSVGAYSAHIWLTTSFITALPGLIAQLTVIPLIIFGLRRTKLVC